MDIKQKGSHLFFEIKGVSQELMDSFSTRAAKIEAESVRRFGSLQNASAEDHEHIGRILKKSKRDLIPPGKELFGIWRDIAAEHGVTAQGIEKLRHEPRTISPREMEKLREAVYHDAISKLEAEKSHFDRADIVQEVCQHAQGRFSSDHALQLIEEKLSGNSLLHLGGQVTREKNSALHNYMERVEQRYTTPANWATEEAMRAAALRLKSQSMPLSGQHVDAALAKRPTINSDQEKAVRYLCTGSNIRCMTGDAGVGKTFVLGAVREAYEAAGYTLIGCAVQSKVLPGLRQESGLKADTLDMILTRIERGLLALNSRTVIVLDEAGMVGTVRMTRLLQHAAKANAKVLLVGDWKQLQAIEAGGPFKHLCVLVDDVLLKKIIRQPDVTRHKTIQDFAYGRSREALAAIIDRGEFHEGPTKADVISRLVERWVIERGVFEPERVLLVANTNADRKAMNRECQAVRILARQVDPAQKLVSDGELIHPGDEIVIAKFDRKRGIANGDEGRVTAIDEHEQTLTVQLRRDKREVTLPLVEFQDKVKLGYTRTTYAVQGSTTEVALVLVGGSMQDRHSTYVQASRAKFETHFYAVEDECGPEYQSICRKMALDRSKDLAHDVAKVRPPMPREPERREQEPQRRDRGIPMTM